MTGTILLTGGTGKTASRIADKLQSRNIPVLLASLDVKSSGPAGFKAVRFDWYDVETYSNPFDEDKNIDTVYIVFPYLVPGVDAIAMVKKFIDFAKGRGIGRFLLMSAAGVEKGLVPQGLIHAHLDAIGVDYAVLKPSWFFGTLICSLLVKSITK